MSNTELIERLKEEMKKNGINARELAAKAGVGQSFVYDILNGKSLNPTTAKLAAIADVLGVNIASLMDSSGKDEFYPVPEIIGVSKSKGKYIEGAGFQYFHNEWLQKNIKSKPHNLRAMVLKSDSMHPVLKKKDLLLVDISLNRPASGIFSIHDGMGILIRRLEKKKSVKKIEVIAENQQYRSFSALPAELDIIGKVIWFSRGM